MSDIRTILAVTFFLFVGITLFSPAFPPAQFIYDYVGIPHPTMSILGISSATLFNGIANGFFWTIIVAIGYGLVELALHSGRPKFLPPMPVAPQMSTPPLENPLVDSRGGIVPPALTILPDGLSFVAEDEPDRVVMSEEVDSIEYSIIPVEAENTENFEGIGLVCGDLLSTLGIGTVTDLLRMGATESGRNRIANKIGLTSATVLRWVCREDLLRVKGVGKKYSALLERAGVNTARDLSAQNTHNLSQALKAVNKDTKLVVRNPPPKTIKIWVRNAKKLEPVSVE